MDMKGNKGQGLSMGMLVVAAISVMVLLVMGVFFTGGFRKVGTSMMGFIEGSADEDASMNIVACQNWCIAQGGMDEGIYVARSSEICYSAAPISDDCDGKFDCKDYCDV